jgi:hypothetical protein
VTWGGPPFKAFAVADPLLDDQLQAALAEPPARVRRVDLADGRWFWLKRVERLQSQAPISSKKSDRSL